VNWLNRLRLLWSLKASDVQSLIYYATNGQPIWTPARYDALAKEGYSINATVFACVNEIAGAVSQFDWLLFKMGGSAKGKKRTQIESHPLLDLLARPNERQGTAAFFEAVAAYYELAGNSYINLVGPNDVAPPKELWLLRPDRITIMPDSVSGVKAYRYTLDGRWNDISAARILHSKTFHPLNDWYGMSPIEVAARAIDTDNESLKWNKALLQNAARPSGAFVAKGLLGEMEHARMKTELAEAHTGASHAGRFMLLEGVEWKAMGLNPMDMDWLEGRKMTKREICQAFQVPPELIGDGEQKTYSNYQEARKAFYHETVIPLMSRIRDDFNNTITPRFGPQLRLEYDLDNVPALAEDQEKLWTRVQAAEHLTINEKRELTGYDDVDGGDVILVSATMIPLDAAGVEEGVVPGLPAPTPVPEPPKATPIQITTIVEAQTGTRKKTVQYDKGGRPTHVLEEIVPSRNGGA